MAAIVVLIRLIISGRVVPRALVAMCRPCFLVVPWPWIFTALNVTPWLPAPMITWRWWLMHRIVRRWRIPVHFYGWRILVVVSLLLPVLLSSRRPRGVVMAIAALLLLRATEHDRREEVGDAVAVAGGAPAAAVRALADDLGATLLPRPRLRPLVKGKAGPIARSGPPQEGTRDQKKQEAHSQTDAAAGQRQRSPPSLADRAKKPLFMVADHDDAPTRKGSTAPRCDPMRRLSAERTLWRDFWISRFRVVFFFSSFAGLCPCLFLLAPWSAGGGDRKNVALSYVYANSGCVAASWLCVL